LRHGLFSLKDHALLLKHVNLESVLNNIYLLKGLMDANEERLGLQALYQKPLEKKSEEKLLEEKEEMRLLTEENDRKWIV